MPAVVGFGKAVEVLYRDIEGYRQTLKGIKESFCKKLKSINGIKFNGENTVNSILSITFEGISNELLQTLLDINGISVSLGSACTAGSAEPSHVLMGMNYDRDYAKSTIRVSMHKNLTTEDIEISTKKIAEIVNNLKKK